MLIRSRKIDFEARLRLKLALMSALGLQKIDIAVDGGQPVHCRSSTIRRCVATTFKTGQACKQVPAYEDVGTLTGIKTIKYLISTESYGGVVFLRIEHVPCGCHK